MTFFLNAIINLRHPEEARSAVSKDASFLMQHRFPAHRRFFHRVSAETIAATRLPRHLFARIDRAGGHPHTPPLSCPMLRRGSARPARHGEESGDDARSRHDRPVQDVGAGHGAAGGPATTIIRVGPIFPQSYRAGEQS
jgi:hypothetical protein